jgi:hypothetical protein
VHLSDGGLSDNIGLRAPYNALSVDQWGLREAINTGRIERLVFITVDAKPKSESRLDKCARPASFPTVLNAAATNPMENYSADTIELVRTWFREWDEVARRYDRSRERCDELAEETCGQAQGSCFERQRDACRETFRATDAKPPPHPTLYRVHVRFDAIPESEAKRRMQGVATRLQLAARRGRRSRQVGRKAAALGTGVRDPAARSRRAVTSRTTLSGAHGLRCEFQIGPRALALRNRSRGNVAIRAPEVA